VSFGGSSMLVTLLSIGMLLSFARHEPGAQAALRVAPGVRRAPRRRRRRARAAHADVRAGEPDGQPHRARRQPAPGAPRRARGAGPGVRARPAPPVTAARPLSVVVAGRAARPGTSSRPSPWPTPCAAAPDAVVTALGHRTGLEARLVPARGYALAEMPRVPLPRRPTLDLLRLPGRVAGAVRVTARTSTACRPTSSSASAATSRLPAYLAARRRGTPARRARGERRGRAGQPRRRPHHPARRGRRRGQRAARRPGARHPAAPGHRRARPRRLPRRCPPRARAARDGPVLLVTGGSQGAQRINTAVTGAAADLAAAGVQVLHVAGPKQADAVPRRPDRRGAATTCCRTSTAWTSPTPPPTSRSAGPAP
jgi:hypothetical protein